MINNIKLEMNSDNNKIEYIIYRQAETMQLK